MSGQASGRRRRDRQTVRAVGFGRAIKLSLAASMAAVMLVGASCATQGAEVAWELVWSDEFSGRELDSTKWASFEGRYGNPPRLQMYRTGPENVRVADGTLILRATHDPGDGSWHSGMAHTNDSRLPNNPDWAAGNLGWQYGRFEVRARRIGAEAGDVRGP